MRIFYTFLYMFPITRLCFGQALTHSDHESQAGKMKVLHTSGRIILGPRVLNSDEEFLSGWK